MNTISVIIPTIDRPEYLQAMLRMLSGQTIKPDEIIIIDQSEKSCKDELPDSVIYKHVAPCNPGTARNIGSQLATSNILPKLVPVRPYRCYPRRCSAGRQAAA
jgi:glycosyltransferase involved in cell wall biosynthesis